MNWFLLGYALLYFGLAVGFSIKQKRMLSVTEAPLLGCLLGALAGVSFLTVFSGMPLLFSILGALLDYQQRYKN